MLLHLQSEHCYVFESSVAAAAMPCCSVVFHDITAVDNSADLSLDDPLLRYLSIGNSLGATCMEDSAAKHELTLFEGNRQVPRPTI